MYTIVRYGCLRSFISKNGKSNVFRNQINVYLFCSKKKMNGSPIVLLRWREQCFASLMIHCWSTSCASWKNYGNGLFFFSITKYLQNFHFFFFKYDFFPHIFRFSDFLIFFDIFNFFFYLFFGIFLGVFSDFLGFFLLLTFLDILDLWDFFVFFVFFCIFSWFFGFFKKVNKVSTRSYWGFYWKPKMGQNSIIRSFFCPKGPRSGQYLLVYPILDTRISSVCWAGLKSIGRIASSSIGKTKQ